LPIGRVASRMIGVLAFVIGVAACLVAAGAQAGPVGELHRVVSDPTASLRDAEHSSRLRVTVWYPAAPGSVETELLIGPPARPLFDVGAVAANAAFATDQGRRPVIVLSHGFGGTARIMGWFGIAMARHGYIVVAVDHPGNNTLDTMTFAGAALWWDRAEDLRVALAAVEADRAIGPHLDTSRIGAAGFSAGGFTALVLAGARVDPTRFVTFCAAHPADADCLPQREFAASVRDLPAFLQRPEIAAEAAHAGDNHAIAGLKAAFVMAPGLVQALDPASLRGMHVPITIMLGDADVVAPPATNGLVAAAAIPGAALKRLPGVGHYDFLATCTAAGRDVVPVCKARVSQADTHDRAIAAALGVFAGPLGVR
jgi:predicted dienelactone hydrolase